MIRTFISLLIIFTLSFCVEKNDDLTQSKDLEMVDKQDSIRSDTTDNQTTADYTYLALGDSYTIGESVDQSDRWPVQLVDSLKSNGISISDPMIIAKTGWTTNELLTAISEADVKQTFDLVSLLIGVNNQYRGLLIDQQKREFEQLLIHAIAFAGGNRSKVFVVSIPDYGVTPFGKNGNPDKIATEIDQYNALNKEIANLYQIQYFDITPISRLALENSDLIARDGLHPSGLMYQEWVKLIFPWVKTTFIP